MHDVVEIQEYLRCKMVAVAEVEQSFTHPRVVAVSQQLDRFIVQVQRSRLHSDGQELTKQVDGAAVGSGDAAVVKRTARALPRTAWRFRSSVQDPYPIA